MLVTLEGIDGSGKTSAWNHLRETRSGPLTFTREPTDSWYGDAVRRSIGADEADSLAELFLFTADHAAHLSETIRPALERDEVVISDRYSDSRYAYQGAAIADRIERPVEYIMGIHQPFTRPPDATIYLDVDPATGARRSGTTNKLEGQEFLGHVAQNYERLIDREPDRFVRIDATADQSSVFEAVDEALDRILDA
ncbi:Thymidylate kinase [Halanaeroarchaeum sp. HSR-CO]|uniref:dTMP kinase n=1 Tax=Halanaeroarchaeum sp. HSR-CO TaxID=2866382 RepID=UPI00217D5F24|nr:dTMP kinase [Halanaeroarchaeum sp. HSR-CO]UWG48838.1 Thymidylate kinase [Halanaeroarchaeum sp. HSR-CO]